jgi:hypothetical protein
MSVLRSVDRVNAQLEKDTSLDSSKLRGFGIKVKLM